MADCEKGPFHQSVGRRPRTRGQWLLLPGTLGLMVLILYWSGLEYDKAANICTHEVLRCAGNKCSGNRGVHWQCQCQDLHASMAHACHQHPLQHSTQSSLHPHIYSALIQLQQSSAPPSCNVCRKLDLTLSTRRNETVTPSGHCRHDQTALSLAAN